MSIRSSHPSRAIRRRSTSSLVRVACAGLLLALTACQAGNADSRALPGTDADESLDKLLKGYELTLPQCEVDDLVFGGRSRGVGKYLLLRFEAPKGCVDTYLDEHGVNRDTFNTWPFPQTSFNGKKLDRTRPPFPEDTMEKFDLDLDPEKTYRRHTAFHTTDGSEFTALIVPRSGDTQAVYLVSTYNGED